MAVGDFELCDILRRKLQIGTHVYAPAHSTAAEIDRAIAGVNPPNLPNDACGLKIAPVADYSRISRKIGEVEAGLYIGQLDTVCINALVSAGAGSFQSERDAAPLAAD